MEFSSIIMIISSLLALSFFKSHAANSKLFREYIGAESSSIKLSDVPITNSEVEVHFILAFALDYTDSSHPSPTNGKFNIFWDSNNIGPKDIVAIKNRHGNVKVAVSLGGDSVTKHHYAYFAPKSVESWVHNAVSSLTSIIKQYGLDGIDIDYEHFYHSDPNTFAQCIGQLITTLKKSNTISFASIAPYEDDGPVQSHYKALWGRYSNVIDYVNFQFYAYDKLSVSQFIGHFNEQRSNFEGGQILASIISGGESGGLGPNEGFFGACEELIGHGKLGGIFVWCADESAKFGFAYEKRAMALLASA